MPIVVDANLIVVLATKDPRSEAVERHLRSWIQAGETLHAPALFTYEVASALARLVGAGRLAANEIEEAWTLVDKVPVHLHLLTAGPFITQVALRLRRSSAYDAAYIVLAQQLGAELWTLDGPLARNATGLGFPVHLVE